ncbi:unnamed protein product [Closterium sp. Naga37s-1]|nr:unnamed protein product [Closterium sp. Naga37s-1]
MAAIITEHTVADLVRSKLGLVEFLESATVAEAIEALVREDLVAAPVYSTAPHAAAALGSLARTILSLPDDSDALSLTAAANKAYTGTVTMVDLLLHVAGGEEEEGEGEWEWEGEEEQEGDKETGRERGRRGGGMCELETPVGQLVRASEEGLSLLLTDLNAPINTIMRPMAQGVQRLIVPIHTRPSSSIPSASSPQGDEPPLAASLPSHSLSSHSPSANIPFASPHSPSFRPPHSSHVSPSPSSPPSSSLSHTSAPPSQSSLSSLHSLTSNSSSLFSHPSFTSHSLTPSTTTTTLATSPHSLSSTPSQHSHKPLASTIASLSLEHLQGVPDAIPYKQPQYTQQAGSTVQRSECNTHYSCAFPSDDEEETEEGEKGGEEEGETDGGREGEREGQGRTTSNTHSALTPATFTTTPADSNIPTATPSTIPPTTPTILPPTPTSTTSPCFRCPGGSCTPSRKFFCPHFCVLTQTDVARWLLDRAPQLEPVPSESLLDLGLIHPRIVTVKCSDNAYEALQLLQSSAGEFMWVVGRNGDVNALAVVDPFPEPSPSLPSSPHHTALTSPGDVNALAVVDPFPEPTSPSSSKSTKSTQVSSAADPNPREKLVGQLSSVDLRGCTAQFAARNLRGMTVQDLLLAVPATERYWRSRERGEQLRLVQQKQEQQEQQQQQQVKVETASENAAVAPPSTKRGQLRPVSKCKPSSNLCAAMAQALAHRNHRVWVVDDHGCPTADEPLLVRAARGEAIPRPPAWMMRQAGRYMAAYQKLSKNHPSFRERSETTDLIVEITLQPWRAFKPDGVILFSDILTPLDAMGIPFEIDENKGPIIDSPIRTTEALKALTPVQLDKLHFVDESLRQIRKEIEGTAALLGFVGAPWTLATYCVEGGTTRTYTKIKGMIHSAPDVLRALLQHLANEIATYAAFQVDAGAQCIQVFDSWGGQLPPDQWDEWAKPYIIQVISQLKAKHPTVPVVLYANGSGGLMERMATTGADVIGVDWTIDMADARARIDGALKASPGGSAKPRLSVQGNVDPAVLFASKDAVTDAINRIDGALRASPGRSEKPRLSVQGNVDPAVLFASKDAVTDAIHRASRAAYCECCQCKGMWIMLCSASKDAITGPGGHILNLGHDVVVGTCSVLFSTGNDLPYFFPPFIPPVPSFSFTLSHSCVAKAGPRGHILNLGHGVLVGTPEESVLHFFETTRALKYAEEPVVAKA